MKMHLKKIVGSGVFMYVVFLTPLLGQTESQDSKRLLTPSERACLANVLQATTKESLRAAIGKCDYSEPLLDAILMNLEARNRHTVSHTAYIKALFKKKKQAVKRVKPVGKLILLYDRALFALLDVLVTTTSTQGQVKVLQALATLAESDSEPVFSNYARKYSASKLQGMKQRITDKQAVKLMNEVLAYL